MTDIKSRASGWGYIIFLLLGVTRILVAIPHIDDNTKMMVVLFAVTPASIVLGSFGWNWIIRQRDERWMYLYFVTQILLVGFIYAVVASEIDRETIPLLGMALMFQAAVLPIRYRWLFWIVAIILVIAIRFTFKGNSQEVYVFAAGDTLVLGTFGFMGLLAMREFGLREQVKSMVTEIEDRHKKEIEHLEELKSTQTRFIDSATHDLKNPLGIVKGYAGLMLEDAEASENPLVKDFSLAIIASVEQMQQIVEEMLELAQLEYRITLNRQPVQVGELLRTCVNNYSMNAKEKDIELVFTPPQPDFSIAVDSPRMIRVMDNLISNAIKYTPTGGHVEVHVRRDSEQVVIDVQDTGLGIPPEAMEHLFDAFYRVDAPSHRDINGTGLGLAIVKAIIQHHDGSIEVKSDYGSGSTFSVHLPLPTATDLS